MQCGIHQGGYLSLLKYVAFIDPLLRKIQNAGVGCSVVGIPAYLFGNFGTRVDERISKGRRAFNSILNTGIKQKGLGMSIITSLYWSIVVPVVTYGSEVWVLKGDEIDALRKFQRYVGRRSQRFPQRSPNFSAYAPLGWVSLEKVVYVKKLLFLRSICVMKDEAISRRLLMNRTHAYNNDRTNGRTNVHNSPMFEIYNVAERVNLLDECLNMALNGHFYGKKDWNRIVWSKVWALEDEEILLYKNQLAKEKLLFRIVEKPYYLTWWVISDLSREHIDKCEIMAKMICEASLLKTADTRLKNRSLASRFCEKCDLSSEETAMHIVMQCPFFEEDRRKMFAEMEDLACREIDEILNDAANIFLHLMGKHPPNVSFDVMYEFWVLVASHISYMYRSVITGR